MFFKNKTQSTKQLLLKMDEEVDMAGELGLCANK